MTLSSTVRDLRFALRQLLARPGFSAVALGSLALGIAVNVTAFSVADALYLRPLPVERPAEIAALNAKAEHRRDESFFFVEYRELARRAAPLARLTAYSHRGAMLKSGESSEFIGVLVADGNFFETLGLKPHVGRLLSEAEDSSPDAAPNVVLGHSLFQRRFNADPSIVGSQIRINNSFVNVVGVAPASFRGLQPGDVIDLYESPAAWTLTAGGRPEIEDRTSRQFEILGRLRPGSSVEQLNQSAAALGRRLATEFPRTNRDVEFSAVSVREQQILAAAPAAFGLALVGLVLWIACANVAGLELARGEARRREMGLRQALGASRARLLRQLLTESALLSGLGAVVGLLLARFLIDLVPALVPPSATPLDYAFRLDTRALLFALAATLATTLLVGLLPALAASRLDILSSIRREEASRARLAFRSALVVAQIALSVVLLHSAALLVTGFYRASTASPGFDLHRSAAALYLYIPGDTPKATNDAYSLLSERAAALPGVRSATYARRLPLFASGGGATVKLQLPSNEVAGIHYNEIAPNYFSTVGTRLLRGRFFSEGDQARSAPVVIVSEAFVRRFFPDRNPLEESIRAGGQALRIVGVVEDTRVNELHETFQPYVYFPFAQRPAGEATLLLECPSPEAQMPALKRLLREAAPQAEILEAFTMQGHARQVLFPDWLRAILSSSLAGLGVVLASVGLFAAITCVVGRRLREFGIRLALGAPRAGLFRLVLRQSLRLAVPGCGLGLLLAAGAGRLLASRFAGLDASGGAALAASLVLTLAISLVAAFEPARRAARIDPADTLRQE